VQQVINGFSIGKPFDRLRVTIGCKWVFIVGKPFDRLRVTAG
jgi:hypothetical protein